MANIQKSNDAAYEAIAADTGVADIARIKSFMESKGITDPSELVGSDELLAELIDYAKGAIAPTAPSKPAKRGRKPKSRQDASMHPLAVAAQQTEAEMGQILKGIEAGADELGREWGDRFYETIAYRPFETAFNRAAELTEGADPEARFQDGFKLFNTLTNRDTEVTTA